MPNLKKITDLPSASTPLSGGELFEISQKDINGKFKSRKVSLRKLVNPLQDEHNELKNIQGGDSTLNEYYHLDLLHYNRVDNDEYTLRTETANVSASGLQQAKDYTDTEILALSASYDEHNELKNIQGGAPSAYYHLDQDYYNRIINDEYTLRTETAAVSAGLQTQIVALSAAIGYETYSGIASLSNGVSAVNIIYDQAQVDEVYSLVTQLRNEVDSPPSIYNHIVTSKTALGFSVLFSGILDSGNYKLDFILSRNQSASSSSSSSSLSSSSSSSSVSSSSSSSSSSVSSSSSSTPAIPLTGLDLWLKSDTGVTLAGSQVTQWNDQSGNSNHATQGSSSLRPLLVTNQLNGYPAIRFDGIDDYLQVNGIGTLPTGIDKPMSVFVVTKRTSALAQNTAWLSWYSSNIGDYQSYVGPLGHEGGQYQSRKRDSAGIFKGAGPAGTTTINSFIYCSVVWSGTTASIWEDGVLQINAGDINLGSTFVDRAVIGALFFNYNGSNKLYHLQGDIVEMLVYDSALNTTDRQAVEAYLATKYGL